MFIVTNREVFERGKKKTGVDRFGKTLNPKGANELRVAEAVRTSAGWSVTMIPDEATPAMKATVGLGDVPDPVPASRYVARRLLGRINPRRAKELQIKDAKGPGKNLLFFVHGFNNNVKAVLDRARNFETLYDVEVLAFSWPANGGGARGVASYKSDKRDAKASIGALDRVLESMLGRLAELNGTYLEKVRADAMRQFEDDPERREKYISACRTGAAPSRSMRCSTRWATTCTSTCSTRAAPRARGCCSTMSSSRQPTQTAEVTQTGWIGSVAVGVST